MDDASERIPAGRRVQDTEEERFRLLVKESVDMVFRRTGEGRFLEVSAPARELLGAGADQVVGTDIAGWVHPADLEDFAAVQQDLDRFGRAVGVVRFRRADKGSFWGELTSWLVMDEAGEVIEVRGFVRRSGEKARSQLLRMVQDNARSVIDSANDAFVSIDDQGLVIDWNGSAERLFGFTRQEVMGRQLAETIIPGRYRADHRAGLARVLAGGEQHVIGRQVELSALHRDGHEIPIELAVWPMQLGTGRCFNAFIRDISQRKRAEQALAEARDQALQASQAKSQFVASMSHEIRTPMNGVIGLVELLLGTGLDAEQRRYAEGAQAAGTALLSLINDILDFSKLEAGKLELDEVAFCPQQLVEEVVSLVAQTPQAEGLELIGDCHLDLPVMMLGDAGRVRQILLNLASNAVKFTERGEVVVRAVPAVGQPSAGDASWLRFEVVDTGIGIAKDKQERMFDAFSQADASTTRRYGGTGLGLAICRRLTQAMGGSIGVTSRLGEGSTFWFTVPLRTPDPAEQPPAKARPATLQGLRVLVVDDNETNRLILDTQLRRWDMQPTTVEGGPQALVALHEAAAAGRSFDLVILDMQMPDMDGMELASRITTDHAIGRVPMLMLSSSTPLPAAELNAAGIARSLPKPVRSSQLMDLLAELTHTAPPADTTWAAATQAATPDTSRPAHRGHLLLAEDNEINQMVATGLLARLGYSLDVASDGIQALQLSQANAYQAVLMDCQMPGMDGYTATRELRRREAGTHTHLPVIAMTAGALAEDRERCLAAGMDDYVSKPVSADALDQALTRWVQPPQPEADDALQVSIEQRLTELRGDGTPAEDELVDRLVDHFLARAPEMTGALFHALDRQDAPKIAEQAHSLKGAAGNIGSENLAGCCEELEQRALAADPPSLAETAPRLQDELDRTCRILATLRSRSPGHGPGPG
ncbi:response regulator [Streptomyces sp. HUCO-GS316]|uniref:response regulator n=1 Tax=Streptomyces sp. HUCO-GS316 TaxID=2692198 RepID=UPI00136D66F3|nr:response regulator [Streptomyces sp. HUCO-GS316]MXM64776.1 response regulator [Streptomyces sp. HUCO-GS316]